MDYVMYRAETVQKKRPTPRSASKIRTPVAPVAVRRGLGGRGRGRGGDDDDDTDDDDWTGGPRVLEFGAQAVTGGRVTRQRVQV
jgi:cohesin loading factor subunit SCC2